MGITLNFVQDRVMMMRAMMVERASCEIGAILLLFKPSYLTSEGLCF